ncbi:hypothetical protein FA15DRAFT_617150 [Coprinopsis marcescibilis]|uniref:Sld7 C-terminal domain-containing protein n=1 Tax=Coprinopsis marcescibilis TaxID=230819 RepID=A0A5C3LBJ6_COPMA|nr:hypothetical protein FA15DRAFT_617150 [Coprinopsis marcescibilis]
MTVQTTAGNDEQAKPHTTPSTPGNALNHPQKTPTTATPTNHHNTSYRLLYRGALSLPDSYLLLDGLTFFARLDSPTKHSGSKSYSLLENPLALALESMRGRPSLRFMGVVKLSELYIDEAGNVEMDIHPRASLSRIYFENMFCLSPFQASEEPAGTPMKSDIGVKVALGDSDGPETTEIIIYGQLRPHSGSSPDNNTKKTIVLTVGRITIRPVPQKRVPRPDDPIPRKPPVLFAQELQRAGSKGALAFGGGGLKRVGSANFTATGGPMVAKRPKLIAGSSSMNDVFKVPEVPNKSARGNERVEDVFGDVSESLNDKGKEKAAAIADDPEQNAAALEKANKLQIKKATIAHLAQTKDPNHKHIVVDKQHPEFKDLYGTISRGVSFALRNRTKIETIDATTIERLLRLHVKLYLSGHGPPDTSAKLPAQLGKVYGTSKAASAAGTTEDPIWIER